MPECSPLGCGREVSALSTALSPCGRKMSKGSMISSASRLNSSWALDAHLVSVTSDLELAVVNSSDAVSKRTSYVLFACLRRTKDFIASYLHHNVAEDHCEMPRTASPRNPLGKSVSAGARISSVQMTRPSSSSSTSGLGVQGISAPRDRPSTSTGRSASRPHRILRPTEPNVRGDPNVTVLAQQLRRSALTPCLSDRVRHSLARPSTTVENPAPRRRLFVSSRLSLFFACHSNVACILYCCE